jgi:hypothetical protein
MQAIAKAQRKRANWRIWLSRLSRAGIILVALLTLGTLTFEAGLRLYYRLPAVERYFAPAENSAGYGLRASQQYEYLHNGRRVTVTTDADGRRVVPNAPAQAQRTLYVIGDSQVFGWGLSDDESIPARLQRQLGEGWHVINLGVPGYGPFQYAEQLAKVPNDGLALVILTETNDFQDSFFYRPPLISRCGYLVTRSWLGERMPCFLLSSYALAKFAELRVRLAGNLPVPLGYSPNGQSAAKVLQYRIENLFRGAAGSKRGHVIFASIPWDAAVDAGRLLNYEPALSEARRFVELPDDCKIEREFQQHPNPGELFQKNDSHLSPAGAELMAEKLAPAILSASQAK